MTLDQADVVPALSNYPPNTDHETLIKVVAGSSYRRYMIFRAGFSGFMLGVLTMARMT